MSGPFMPEWLEQALTPAPADKTGYDKPRRDFGQIPTMRATSPVQQTQMGVVRKAKSQARNNTIVQALKGLSIGGMLEEGAMAASDKDYKGAAVAGAFAALPLAHNVKGLGKLLRAISESPGGATLEATGEKFMGHGYMVADPAFTIKSANPADIQAFFARKDVREALSKGKLVGTWTDPDTHITEVNLSDRFSKVHEAQQWAQHRGEKAIGNIQAGEYKGDIPTQAPRAVAGSPGPVNPMTGEPFTVAGRTPGTRAPDARVQPGDPIRPPVDFLGRKVPAGKQMPAEPKPPIAAIPNEEIERGSKIADLTQRIQRKKEQLGHANGEYALQLEQDVQIMADRLEHLRKQQMPKAADAGEAIADSVVSQGVKHLPSTGRTLPLDVSINPPGIDASRPPLYRPKKADLSVLDAVKRRVKSVYTPAAERGIKENPIGAAWYDMSPAERAFIDESPTGKQDFKMFMDLMGPTSAGTNVPMNMRQASFFYQQWKQGKLTPEMLLNRGVKIPEGFGNRLRIAESLEKVLFGKGLDPITTPKTFRYSNQLGGRSWGGVALDRHVGRNIGVEGAMEGGKTSTAGISRAFPEAGFKKTGKVSSSPDNNHYAAIEDAMVSEADRMGVHPAAYQAAGWVGNAAKTNVEDARHPLEILNEKLEHTASKYGYKSGSDALRAFIRGETPLWAVGGITSAGMMGRDDEDQ